MTKVYNSIPARFAQGDAGKIPELQPHLSAAYDLQVRKLCQRFGLSPEASRAIAHLAFTGARS